VISLAVYVFHNHIALIKEGQESYDKYVKYYDIMGKIPVKYKDDLENSTSDIQKIVNAFFRNLLAVSVSDIETRYVLEPGFSPNLGEA
jgi:hypothetical protein